ncbi:uncharacterized protein [Miscanthus floridulus]|uniref:uncharacterized protein n=1 Tax=Miscanthus floridulus TaxID=154761 RepID=UPI00345B48A6
MSGEIAEVQVSPSQSLSHICPRSRRVLFCRGVWARPPGHDRRDRRGTCGRSSQGAHGHGRWCARACSCRGRAAAGTAAGRRCGCHHRACGCRRGRGAQLQTPPGCGRRWMSQTGAGMQTPLDVADGRSEADAARSRWGVDAGGEARQGASRLGAQPPGGRCAARRGAAASSAGGLTAAGARLRGVAARARHRGAATSSAGGSQSLAHGIRGAANGSRSLRDERRHASTRDHGGTRLREMRPVRKIAAGRR